MYKENLALNNLQWLICHKTQPNQTFTARPCFLVSPKGRSFKKEFLSFLTTEEKELTCTVLMGDRPVKSFIDTGVSVSLINATLYNQLVLGKYLKRLDLVISQAEGSEVRMSGSLDEKN